MPRETSADAHRLREILATAKRLAVEYYQLTGKPLGVTGEVAEYVAAETLGLKLAPPRTHGYDALRGIDPKVTEPSLAEILKAFKEKHIELLLAGMEAPRNWGPDYDGAFRAMYPRLAQDYGALLYPFFLKDVAAVQSLNLADGLHPTPDGVAIVVRNILPEVEKLIALIREKRAMNHS